MRIMLVVLALVLWSGCAIGKQPIDKGWMSYNGGDYHINRDLLPLHVWIHRDVDPKWHAYIKMGVREFNDMIGVPVLRDPVIVSRPKNRVGAIYIEAIKEGNPNTSVNFVEDDEPGTIGAVLIKLPPTAGPFRHLLLKVILHEFGHAFGLEHDDEIRFSVMHPYLTRNPQNFTDADYYRLRARYREMLIRCQVQ